MRKLLAGATLVVFSPLIILAWALLYLGCSVPAAVRAMLQAYRDAVEDR